MKKKILYLLLLCMIAISFSGCTIEVPQYWLDRCYPLNFHLEYKSFDLTLEEIEEKYFIDEYFPIYMTDKNCVAGKSLVSFSIFHRGVENAEKEMERYKSILTSAGFGIDESVKSKGKYYCDLSKVIKEDYEGEPLTLNVSIIYYENEYAGQYNVTISYYSSNKEYFEALAGEAAQDQSTGENEL